MDVNKPVLIVNIKYRPSDRIWHRMISSFNKKIIDTKYMRWKLRDIIMLLTRMFNIFGYISDDDIVDTINDIMIYYLNKTRLSGFYLEPEIYAITSFPNYYAVVKSPSINKKRNCCNWFYLCC